MIPVSLRLLMSKRLPVTQWLPGYSSEDAVGDVIAGVTAGLTLLPQAIAYAGLAGLEPQYGLYSAWVGCLVYIMFGTTKQISMGPAALTSLLTFTYTHHLNADMAVFLCFISGCIILLCGLLQLGFLIDFVSVPVISGFTSASALIIASSQLKGLFGLEYNAEEFVDTWEAFLSNLGATQSWDLTLGVVAIVFLLALKTLNDFKFRSSEGSKEKHTFANSLIWFLSVGRNALVVFGCSLVAFVFHQCGYTPFNLTGNLLADMPTLGLPPLSTEINGRHLGFLDMIKELRSGVFIVPLVAIVKNIAISKTFANGARVDASQEMIALGMCNILGSFARSMPVAGAFSRAAVINVSGVSTVFSGLYTSILILLALTLLTPYFYFIPRCTLAAVIMCAVLFMVDVQILRPMWSSNKRDLVPAVSTFVACLAVGVEKGLLVGILVDILILLYLSARPPVSFKAVETVPTYWVVQPHGSLLFPAVDYVRDTVVGRVSQGQPAALVLDCAYIPRSDFTAAQGISAMIGDVKKNGVQVVLLNADDSVVKSLSGGCQQLRVARTYQQVKELLSEDPSKLENGIKLEKYTKENHH